MRGTPRTTGLVSLGEFDLFRPEAFFSEDCGPRWRRVAAPEKFLVDRLMAAAAVAGRQLGRKRKPVMLFPLLSVCRLMTVEAIDALPRVSADFILVHDRVLLLRVAFGALPSRAHKLGRTLSGLDGRSRPIDQKGAQDEREGDDDGNEHGPEGHARYFRVLAAWRTSGAWSDYARWPMPAGAVSSWLQTLS